MNDIALQVRAPQIESPLEAQGKVLQLRQLLQADQMAQIQMQQTRQSMADDASYRTALQTNPGGGEALQQALASAGNYKGHAAAVKADQDARKGKADISKTEADTRKTAWETANHQFEVAGQMAGAWSTNPAITKQTIQAGLKGALAMGIISPEVAQTKLGELETTPDDPASLNGWAKTALMQITKAKDQHDLTTVDANTKANNEQSDKNSRRSEGTAIHGQNLTNSRMVDANTIAREAASSQVVETPQGFVVVNKGTAMSRPVAGEGNQPVLGKDSVTAKNAQMADRLVGMIPLARQLLQSGATSSGAGAMADNLMGFAGLSTKGADAATALETVSGWMTSNVPRFEGPQSDKDTATYRTMAGLVGDRTKPMSTRLKALDTVQALMQPYAGNRTLPFSGPPGTQPATVVPPRPLLPPRGGSPAPAVRAPAIAPAPGAAPTVDINSFFL